MFMPLRNPSVASGVDSVNAGTALRGRASHALVRSPAERGAFGMRQAAPSALRIPEDPIRKDVPAFSPSTPSTQQSRSTRSTRSTMSTQSTISTSSTRSTRITRPARDMDEAAAAVPEQTGMPWVSAACPVERPLVLY